MQEINVRQAEHIFPENLKLLRQTFKNKGLRQATFHIHKKVFVLARFVRMFQHLLCQTFF